MLTRMTLKFIVEGQGEGTYSAVIATYEDGDVFYLDAVLRNYSVARFRLCDIFSQVDFLAHILL